MRDEKERLIALLEEHQDDESFENAKRFLEEALAQGESAELLLDYGYIHDCRGRTSIRQAIRWYERALALGPTAERVHHQLIAAHAALAQTQDAIDLYKERLASSPQSLVEYRCLAHAYLAAGEYEEAGKVIEAGLALEPDVGLLEQQGAVLSGRGLQEEALETWQRVLELDGERASARYSRAFLLERMGRRENAIAEWEALIAWLREHGYDIEAEWPLRELSRLRGEI